MSKILMYSYPAALIVFCSIVLLAFPANAFPQTKKNPARVAIFDGGPHFSYYGSPDTLEPGRLLKTLEEIGIHAYTLDAGSLSDPVLFNAREYAVLIHIYGNTFPFIAAENLRQFHRDGGSILATGVPFCHPCVASGAAGWGDVWSDAVRLVENSHTGRLALEITHRTGDWSGIASKRLPTSSIISRVAVCAASGEYP